MFLKEDYDFESGPEIELKTMLFGFYLTLQMLLHQTSTFNFLPIYLLWLQVR